MSTITKNWTTPIYLTLTYCDNCWTLLATRNAQSLTLSKKDIPLFSYPYSALPPAIQLHLPTESSLNTCATVIHFTSFFLNSKSNVLVIRALLLLNAASAIAILHLISQIYIYIYIYIYMCVGVCVYICIYIYIRHYAELSLGKTFITK